MTWNYRIIKEGDDYSVREVFYSKGKAHSCTAEACPLYGIDMEDLVYNLWQQQKAFNKPILELKGNKLRELK